MSTILKFLDEHTQTRSASDNEVRICCPDENCVDEKFHAYVNTVTGFWYCHKCGAKGNLRSLVYALCGDLHYAEIKALVNKLKKPGALDRDHLTTPDIKSVIAGWTAKPETTRTIEYPEWWGGYAVTNTKALRYLRSRGFTVEELQDYRIRVDGRGAYIIVPFYEGGKLVYWQARQIDGPLKINPKKGETLGKGMYLFNHDAASAYKRVVIVEGWADAITVGKHAVSIQGKVLSEVQCQKLAAMRAKEFVVFLDPDDETALDQVRAAARLARYTTKPILAVHAYEYDKDPNALGRTLCKEILATKCVDTRNSNFQLDAVKISLGQDN